MATRNPITRKFATDYAIAALTNTELPTLPDNTSTDDVIAVLAKMSKSFGTTKRNPNKPTDAQVQNAKLFDNVVKFMNTQPTGVTAKDVFNAGIAGITSAQKASAVMRFAESRGYVHGNRTSKNAPIVYTIA